MSDSKKNVLWHVSLSNGENFYEGKGDFVVVPGEASPWSKLIDYTILNKLSITAFGLHTVDGRVFNLPSNGTNPKFAEFATIEKPIDYDFCRKIAIEKSVVDGIQGEQSIAEHYTIAKAIYNKYTLEIWVDELNTKNSWSIVKGN